MAARWSWAQPSGGTVRMFVKDHGAGIPPGAREKVFGRFSQLDSSDQRRTGGTGLGMNISREIVEAMGGMIDYESELGKGHDLLCRSAAPVKRRDSRRPTRCGPWSWNCRRRPTARRDRRTARMAPRRQNRVTSGIR
jgi:hypothetical protein